MQLPNYISLMGAALSNKFAQNRDQSIQKFVPTGIFCPIEHGQKPSSHVTFQS